jgi:NitT/TauT family transport system substrate-binding protein
MAQALTANRVDAVITAEPAHTRILALGARLVAPVLDAIAPIWIEGGYFCTIDFARTHAEIVRRFADAIAQTDAWANKNHAATAKILETTLKLTVAPAQTRTYYPERLDPAQIQPLIDASAKYGILKGAFPASEIIAPGLLS